MILAIEGVDGCGKTTLWKKLRETLYVPVNGHILYPEFTPLGPKLFAVIEEVEFRESVLFRSLYERGTHYVFDRFFGVTGPAYALAFGRMQTEEAFRRAHEWASETVVLYLDAPVEMLRVRLAARGGDPNIRDDNLQVLRESYETVLDIVRYHTVHRLDVTKSPDELAKIVHSQYWDWMRQR